MEKNQWKKKELEFDHSPCKALMAVAAQAGFAKSTKHNIRGSPPRFILEQM